MLGVWVFVSASLGLWGVVLSLRTWRTGGWARLFRYRSRLPCAWSLGELARIIVLVCVIAALMPFIHTTVSTWGPAALVEFHMWTVAAMLALDLCLVLIIWGFAIAKATSLGAAMGLSGRRGIRAVMQGLRGYAMIFPWVFGLWGVIVTVCQMLGIQPPVEPVQELLFMAEQPWVVWLTGLLACLVGPIVEELFFRGVLFPAIRAHTSRIIAIAASGALFALVHTNWIGFLPIALLGCLLADVYERTGSLWGPITVHMLHNTLLVGMGLTLRALTGVV